MPESTTLEAIKRAMDAEMAAHTYYSQSAQKATNPKGKDMFRQLAALELNHYNNLKALHDSLQEGNGWIAYDGTQSSDTTLAPEGRHSSREEALKDDVLSILSKAIEDEKKASAYYTTLAKEITEPAGKELFTKLAAEEKVHTKILNDQWYSLNNQGVWLWGD
jgi:rubrerythrin